MRGAVIRADECVINKSVRTATASNEPLTGYRGAAVEQHSNVFHSQWLHCPAEEPLERLPALHLGFERRCSHRKTPHQLLHIVFLGCWHTLVHGPASACLFSLQRRWEGRKPPDKNISSSHPLFAQQLFGLSGYLCFLFFFFPCHCCTYSASAEKGIS